MRNANLIELNKSNLFTYRRIITSERIANKSNILDSDKQKVEIQLNIPI